MAFRLGVGVGVVRFRVRVWVGDSPLKLLYERSRGLGLDAHSEALAS